MKQSSRMHRTSSVSVVVLISTLSFSSCAKQSRQFVVGSDSSANVSESAKLNINTATLIELERLPGIGNVIAARIVEHRTKYGSFRRVEHLMMVRGVSEAKFRELSPLVIAR